MTHTLWPRLLQCLLVLALPIVLVTANVRIVTGHWFVHWEYGKADFPPDPYALSVTERTHMAEVCVDYLASNADISLLADLRLPDGERAFNARELRHMADVQVVYNYIMITGIIAGLALLGGIITLSALSHTRRRAPAVLLSGSAFTLGLMGAIGAYMALSWGEFFTMFHRIFFAGESWIFPHSDTLIRLFPMRFWIDVAIVIISLLVIETIAASAAGWLWKRKVGRDA
ncbi:MAG: TIGR01906 family membrane protein [Chloroflexota bacterium]|nr:TIGR01906 family membrane protein [Chloroflexota bacterium]